MTQQDGDNLLEVCNLETHFGSQGDSRLHRLFGMTRQRIIRAVDGVSLSIGRGQVVGLVGESGSGKSTLGRTIIGLEKATAGGVFFEGRDLSKLSTKEMRSVRPRLQMIHQDAAASLSPRFRVSQLFQEAYKIKKMPMSQRRSAEELLSLVELGSEHAQKYPHELSGGQARRVSIARALAMEPDLLVADEPTAGLDVSAVGAIVTLMSRLRTEFGLSYLIITHDLNVVSHFADCIAVMYVGRLVEFGPAQAVFSNPRHPYTQALLAAIPEPGRRRRHKLALPGEIPSPASPPAGCRFHPRCVHRRPMCSVHAPADELVTSGHRVACHFWREIAHEPAKPNP